MRAAVHTLLAGLLVICLGFASTGVASATPKGNNGKGNGVSTEAIQGALKGAPGLLKGSKNSKAKGQSIVLKSDGEVIADVPLDAKKGVKLGKGNKALKVELPNSNKAGRGKFVDNNTVVYSSEGSSANTVNLTDDGVQLVTVMEDSAAPTTYDYEFSLPPGATIGLAMEQVGDSKPVVNGRGGAVILDRDNSTIGMISAPWATDATGKPVETWFSTDGSTLTQHVKHDVSGVTYPVVADPYYRWYWNGVVITLTPSDMLAVAYGGTQTLAWMLAAPGWGWLSYGAVLSSAGWALWAYHNRQCFWFWVSPSPWDPPSMGTYRCRQSSPLVRFSEEDLATEGSL